MNADSDLAPEPIFRPIKRRKFLRRRIGDNDTDDVQGDAQAAGEENDRDQHPLASQVLQETKDVALPTDISRLRRPYKARKGGIEFSATSRQTTNSQSAKEPTTQDLEEVRIQSMCDRFTAHTGQTVDVDKHMMAFIESEMAKRHQRNGPADTSITYAPTLDEATEAHSSSAFAKREPASLGKLHEIDLGQEAKLQNIARTEAATRRLAGDEIPPSEEDDASKSVRLGKDGKPWRHRKRRNSEDIERDRLVEEVLRESKLDVYDEPQEEEEQRDDQAADDRIAEQFRREFLDAIRSRRRIPRTKPKKTAKSDAPRGPKLGGSRSARAAMREMREKSGQK